MGRCSRLIQGKTAVTADTALQLERATGVPSSFWNNAQRNYEAALARRNEAGELESNLQWLHKFPILPLFKFNSLKRRFCFKNGE